MAKRIEWTDATEKNDWSVVFVSFEINIRNYKIWHESARGTTIYRKHNILISKHEAHNRPPA